MSEMDVQQDDALESILAEPWLARPGVRWSSSLVFVIIALFAIKPLIADHLLARAEAYASYGLYNNAIRESQKVIFLDQTNVCAWDVLASSYKSQGDLENAINTYLTAINIDSENRIAYFKVAMLFALEESYNQAIAHFEQVRAFGPETPEMFASDPFSYYRSSLDMLALCYERTGKLDKMQRVLEELARTYPVYNKSAGKLQALTSDSETRKDL